MKWRLVLALAVAALGSNPFSKETWRKAGKAVRALFGQLPKIERAPEELAKRRLAVCEKCPIFASWLRTCGSPLSYRLRGLGCWCQMDEKAKERTATCWYDDTIGDGVHGWKGAGIVDVTD